MGKRKTVDGKPKPLRTAETEAEIEALLDDVDQAVLRGDETRLQALVDRLWPARRQVPEALTRRIIGGRARIPAFAFELLATFAGRQTVSYLKRIAGDRRVADIVRFGAQRRAGWPQRGEAKRRLAFLETATDPEGMLIEAVNQASAIWPPEGEILEEVLGYLIALPSERRRAVVVRAAGELGVRAAWLLHAVLHIPDPATQRLALGELVRLRDPGATGAIGRLARTAQDPEIQAEAAAAIQRLRVHVVGRAKPAKAPPFPPVERALLSMIDSVGGQVAIVVRRWGESAYLFADVFHSDQWGIKGAFGASRATPNQVEGAVSGLEEEGVYLVQVDLAAVRSVLSAAVEDNAATGHGIPPIFELWEPLLHESYPPPDDEPTTLAELDDAPYVDRQDLIHASGELANHRFFQTWSFDPMQTVAAMAVTPPPTGNRLTDRQYRPLIQILADPPARALLRRRLRRQAWLLDQAGEARARELALAVAAQLASAPPAELAKQPFLRAMVQRSVFGILEDRLFAE